MAQPPGKGTSAYLPSQQETCTIEELHFPYQIIGGRMLVETAASNMLDDPRRQTEPPLSLEDQTDRANIATGNIIKYIPLQCQRQPQ